MYGLHNQPLDGRHHGDQRGAHQRPRQQRAGKQASYLRCGLALEDQPGPQPHAAYLRVVDLEAIEQPLHLGLVRRVEGARDTGGGPALVNAAVLWPGSVGSDRGGVDQRGDAGCGNRRKHASAAVDVDGSHGLAVARRLDRPRKMHDGIRALEELIQRRCDHVGAMPLDLGEMPARQPSAHPEDRLDPGFRGQRTQDAGAYVSACADYDNAHELSDQARRRHFLLLPGVCRSELG